MIWPFFFGVLHRVSLKFVHFGDLLRAIHGRGYEKFEKVGVNVKGDMKER